MEGIYGLSQYGLSLCETKSKPWGYTVGVRQDSINDFLYMFFASSNLDPNTVSPRFLIVNPNSRLSWQVHERRNELWRVTKGPVGVMLNNTDWQPDAFEVKEMDSLISIEAGIRHCLIGLDNIGVVAEIWVHTDKSDLSDAQDIIRISDDYNR